MVIHIKVPVEIFEEEEGRTDWALPDEINVGIDSVDEARVHLTEYPRYEGVNAFWQGNGTVLFTSLRSVFTNEWPIIPGRYVVKSTLREDTRYWQQKKITIDANGNATVYEVTSGAP